MPPLRFFKMSNYFLCFWLLMGLALVSCVDRYTPDVPPAAQTDLVVDGFINPQGSTVIKLARTFSVNTKNTAPAEAKARVAIQDDAGRRYPLVESPAGTYSSAANTLDANRQYQLRITTAQGRDYASDMEPVVLTPPVDSLTWKTTYCSPLLPVGIRRNLPVYFGLPVGIGVCSEQQLHRGATFY
jgi:hypothetical protein